MTSAATLARLPTAILADTNGNVGVGTGATTGITANVFSVYGSTNQYGNVVIRSQAAGAAGIYFPDGTFQTTAGGGPGNYGNTNVASYLSGPVLIGNLWIANTTVSTSTTTGSFVSNGGAGIAGNLNVGGNIATTGTSGNITGVNDLSTVTVSASGNLRMTTVGRGIVFPDNSFQVTAATNTPSFGLPGTIQFAGAGNTFSGNSGSLFWDTSNGRLGVGTAVPNSVFNVNGTSVPLFQTSNSQVGSNNFEIMVGNSLNTGTTIGYVNNTTVPYGYVSAGGVTRPITIGANGRIGIGGVTAPLNLMDIGGNVVIGSTWAGNSNFINPPINGLAVQGRVGVGTYTPLSPLDVNGNTGIRGAMNATGAVTVASLVSNATVGVGGATVGGFNVTVYGGNVGSAANSTTLMLNLYSQPSTNGDYLEFLNVRNASGGTDWTTSGNRLQQRVDTTYMAWVGFNNGNTTTTNNGGISFGAGTSTLGPNGVPEVARINSLGEFLVGTKTSPLGGGIVMAADNANGASIQLTHNNSGGGNIQGMSGGGLQFGTFTGAVGAETYSALVTLTKPGTNATGNLLIAGNVNATQEVTAYFSDARLKANVVTITDAMQKICAINGVYYNPNELAEELLHESRTSQKVGLLAQEVQKVMPHVIRSAPFDVAPDGSSKTGQNYMTIQYEKMVPLLVEAIKEQQRTIDDLSARVVKLERIIGGG